MIAAFILAANDPTTQQMNKVIELVSTLCVVAVLFLNKYSRKVIVKSLRTWLQDEAAIEQQKKITEDIKDTVEMIQLARNEINGAIHAIELVRQSLSQVADTVSDLKEVDRHIQESIANLRERLARLEEKNK